MKDLSIAPVPPSSIRRSLSHTQWDQLLDSWILVTKWLLSLPRDQILAHLQQTSVNQFLDSFVQNFDAKGSTDSSCAKRSQLKKHHFLLLHSAFSLLRPVPTNFLEPTFLVRASSLYGKNKTFRKDLEHLWISTELGSSPAFIAFKASSVSSLEKGADGIDGGAQLQSASILAKACPDFARFLMTGADFIDAASDAFAKAESPAHRKQLALTTYILFNSLMSTPKSVSLILDHLYSLQKTPLMLIVIQRTPFFESFKTYASRDHTGGERATALLQFYASCKPSQSHGQKLPKGKGRGVSAFPGDEISAFHVHRMSLVSQIQDLFPDLGSGYIVRLFDEFGDDIEVVTAHLLEDDLPSHLQKANKAEELDIAPSHENYAASLPRETTGIPRKTFPERRNIHDDDDFDRLAVDSSRLHIGRKDADSTADKLLSTSKPTNHKAAILSALAAFDSDDDERDDTYDSTDVGGTIDNTMGALEARGNQDEIDQILFKEYKRDRNAFKRDGETRRSKARSALKTRVNMTDEALEGWSVMIEREPDRLRRLERGDLLNDGFQQPGLAASSWKAQEESDREGFSEDVDNGQESGRTFGTSRGRGGRGRGRGEDANIGGASSHRARQRKDANKASRANHNRRDQRAKKMVRGGGLAG